MKLATVRTAGGTVAARVEDDGLVHLGLPDVGSLLALPDWQEHARFSGPLLEAARPVFAPLIPRPGKIVCVGLNYRHHIQEMGRDVPAHPTLFAKYAESLIGAQDDIELPAESSRMDWEAELGVVIGRSVRRAEEPAAAAAIAGFTVVNDVTARDWQYRTPQWLQGKTFESTTPIGPVLVTPAEVGGVRPALAVTAEVDGDVVQRGNTGDLVFDPVALVQYVSTILTLDPGDVIATGTPGGVGQAQSPPRYLEHGTRLVTTVSGIGRLDNVARRG